MSVNHAFQDGINALQRRRLLTFAGVGVLGGLAASQISSPAAAATTIGTFLDQGGAVFNVKAYGAFGNGSSDDTAAIRAAISAANSAGGGIVYLPSGNYLISDKLEITQREISIVGAGQGSTTILVASNYTGDAIIYNNPTQTNSVPFQSCGHIRSLAIYSTAIRTSGAAIHLVSASNMVVEDVDISQQYIGILIEGNSVAQHINRGYYTNIATDGIGIWINSNTSNDTFIRGIVMNSGVSVPKAGIRITGSGAPWVDSCDFINCRSGLLIDSPSGNVITWGFFSNCAFDTCLDRGILIAPSGGQVKGLTFVNCWAASSKNYDGCYVGGNVDGCEFLGCRFFNNKGNGLLITASAINVSADSCIATGHPSGSGFVVAGNVTKFTIRNCSSTDYGGLPANQYGILIQPGCDNYIITGNYLRGNTVSSIVDNGGANKVISNNLI